MFIHLPYKKGLFFNILFSMLGSFHSLKQKLLFSFLFFTLITILVAFSSYWFYRKTKEVTTTANHVEQILLNFLRIIKIEQDFVNYETINAHFYQTQQSPYLTSHQKLTSQTKADLQKLILQNEIGIFSIQGDSLRNYVQQSLYELKIYEQNFDKWVKLLIERGFKDEGLEGKMRSKIHFIEQSKAGITEAEMLTLRRHEKDYFLRKDSTYTIKHNQLINKLLDSIQKNPLLIEDVKENIMTQLQEYHLFFKKIVAIESLLGENSKSGIKGEMRKRSSKIVFLLENFLGQINQKAQDIQQSYVVSFLIIIIISIVLSLIAAYWFASLITRPVAKLSDFIRHTVTNNFSPKIPLIQYNSHDEIGRLTTDFNIMLKEMQQKFHEINEKNNELEQQNEELNIMNSQLAESEENLSKLNAVKDRFFSILSHDLRSPLNNMLGFLQILEEDTHSFSEKDIKLFTQKTTQSVEGILTLLDNLLRWALSQTGDIKCEPSILNLEQIILTNVDLYQKTAEQKNIKIIPHVEEDLLVRADANMIDFVFRNLISNAIKFSQEGSEIRILHSKKSFKEIEIAIQDEGVGMENEYLKKLFEPSSSKSRQGTHQEKGTGFGLIMCKYFIEQNGGIIQVESSPEQGTTVKFTLQTASVFASHS
jgi:signal transduction histidine kinase